MSESELDVDQELKLWEIEFKNQDLNTARILSTRDQLSDNSSDVDMDQILDQVQRPRKRLIKMSQQKDDNYMKQAQILKKQEPRMSPVKKPKQFEDAAQDNCPICLTNFEELEMVVELDPCKHQACQNCIKKWVEKYQAICPFCRGKFETIWPLHVAGSKPLRGLQPLKLNLDHPKWIQDFDEFYQDPEHDDDGANDDCMICKESHSKYLMLICDGCNINVCHTYCDPAIKDVFIPDGNWYCIDCRAEPLLYTELKRVRRTRSNPRRRRT